MTKKKRQRKEQKRQRGNPPAQITPLLGANDQPVSEPPADLRFLDELDELEDMLARGELDGLDGLDDPFGLGGGGPFDLGEPGPDYQMRPMERNLMRIQRYLER